MTQMEFFRVDIFWSSTKISRNVELSQAALDWYAEFNPLLTIVPAGQFEDLPADIPPVDDPLDELKDDDLPDEEFLGDAIEIIIKGASYGASDEAGFNKVSVTVLLRLNNPSPKITNPTLQIQVKDANNQVSTIKSFALDPAGLNFTRGYIFNTENRTPFAKIDVFVWQDGAVPLARSKNITVPYIVNSVPPTTPPTGAALSPLMPIIGAGAAIAFLSGEFPKKKRRR